MYLSRFGVKHYKCLGEIDIPLTPIHVFIGENDAGKTSLLEAIAAFCASSEKPLNECFPKPWSGRELVLHGSGSDSIEFSGKWEPRRIVGRQATPASFKYGFPVDFPPRGNECAAGEEWFDAGGKKRGIPKIRASYATIKWWSERGEIPDEWRDDFESISSVLRPAHKYALDAKLMAVPAAIDPNRKFRMDPDGFGLATLLDDILDYEAQLFIDLRSRFCEYFRQFKSVRIETEASLQRNYNPSGIHHSGQGVGKGIYFETQGGRTIRAQQASDGAILFLGLLALAHLPDPPNLLLLEEPENGIYPKRLGEVITMLKEMVNRTDGVRFPQIIMSTHSPYVLSFFEPEEVTFLGREPGKADGPVRARPLRDAPNIKERLSGGEFYLGELWYNLSEEELFGEP